MYKEIQMGLVAKSYMRRRFLLYKEMRKYLVIYEKAVSQMWLCNRFHLNFLIYEKNFLFFSISVCRQNDMKMVLEPSPTALNDLSHRPCWFLGKSNITILHDCLFNYCQLLESSTPRRICSRRRRRRTTATRPTRPATTHPRSKWIKFIFENSV